MADTQRRLKEAQRLLRQGVITETEYETRRRAILEDTSGAKGSVAGGILKWGGIGCFSIIGGFILLSILIAVIIGIAASGGGGKVGDERKQIQGTLAVGGTGELPEVVRLTLAEIVDPCNRPASEYTNEPNVHLAGFRFNEENAGNKKQDLLSWTFLAKDATGFEYRAAVTSCQSVNWETCATLSLLTTAACGEVFLVRDGQQIVELTAHPPYGDTNIVFRR